MSRKKTMNAILGFFDILGYANLLKNNDVGKITQEVIEIILNAKKEIDRLHFNSKTFLKAQEVQKFIEYMVISDSILIYSKIKYLNGIDIHWAHFLLFSNLFQKYMFDKGLPVRGVISTGEIYIRKNCFAGKPIIEAYELSKEIKMAACVLYDSAYNEYKNTPFSNLPGINKFDLLIDYPFVYDPLFSCISKGCQFIPNDALSRAPEKLKNSYYLNMMVLKGNIKSESIREYVEDSFSKYLKKIDSKDVQEKIEATINFLNTCANKLT